MPVCTFQVYSPMVCKEVYLWATLFVENRSY
jgi:hypothetical protein